MPRIEQSLDTQTANRLSKLFSALRDVEEQQREARKKARLAHVRQQMVAVGRDLDRYFNERFREQFHS